MTKPGVLAGASADPFDPVALEHRLIEARARRAAVLAARQDATRAAGPTSASPAPEITAPAAATMLAAPDAQGITHRPAGGELAVRHLVIAGACAALLLGAASVALTLHAESRVAALVRQDPPPTPDGPAPDVTIRLAALPDAEGAEPRPIAPALDAPVGAADPGRRVPPGVVAAEPGFDATSIAASREALRVVRAREDLRISRARDEMDAALAALRSVARGSLDDDAGAPEAPDLGDLRLILHAPPAVTQDHLAANLAALRAAGIEDPAPLPARVSISRTNLRYFHPEDRRIAERLAAHLAAVTGDAAIEVRDFTHGARHARALARRARRPARGRNAANPPREPARGYRRADRPVLQPHRRTAQRRDRRSPWRGSRGTVFERIPVRSVLVGRAIARRRRIGRRRRRSDVDGFRTHPRCKRRDQRRGQEPNPLPAIAPESPDRIDPAAAAAVARTTQARTQTARATTATATTARMAVARTTTARIAVARTTTAGRTIAGTTAELRRPNIHRTVRGLPRTFVTRLSLRRSLP